MMKDVLKRIIQKYSVLLSQLYFLISHNKIIIKGTGNNIDRESAFLSHCRFRIYGDNNILVLNKITLNGGGRLYNRFKNCYFSIIGSNNTIVIGTDSMLLDVTFSMEKDNNVINIGCHFDCHGSTELAALEGTKIMIGDDALFSANIKFRTGDSHSVVEMKTGNRINSSRDIIVGEHVWVGNSVTVLKGANIGGHSIVGIGSIVPGKSYPSNCAIGGIPAKILKEQVDWCFEQI